MFNVEKNKVLWDIKFCGLRKSLFGLVTKK